MGDDAVVRVEDSQGDSLQYSTGRFDDLQKAISHVMAEADRLRKICSDYRSQRAELEITLKNLKSDVDRLNSEKEDARIELVSEKEAIAWWTDKEAAASSKAPGAIRDIRSKAETAGRAIRKAHVFEGKVREAEVRYQALEEKHKENLEEERAVASGLRDRIGRLEGRLRAAEKAKGEAQTAYKREKKEREEEAEGWKVKEEKWRSEKQDLLQLRDDLKAKLEVVESRARAVPQDVLPDAVIAQQRTASRPLTPLQTNRPIPTTPSRRSPASKSTAPTTPSSLARRLAYMEDRHRALQAEYDKIREQHEADRQSWKEWKSAHMARQDEKKAKRARRRQERIRLDEAPDEGTRLASSASARGSGAERADPTQATATAALVVVEASQESGVQASQGDAAAKSKGPRSSEGSVEESLDVEGHATQNRRDPQTDIPLDEQETVELPEWCTQGEELDQPIDSAAGDGEVQDRMDRPTQHAAPARPLAANERYRQASPTTASAIKSMDNNTPRMMPHTSNTAGRATSPTKQVQTPQAGPSHPVQATRTTPWLGKATLGRTGSASASHRSNALQAMDDDIFASPPEMSANAGADRHHFAPIPTFSNTTPAKLLVRDRTGRTPANALLRSALHSRPAGHEIPGAEAADKTPSRSTTTMGRIVHTPLARSGSGSTSRLSGRINIHTPGPSTSSSGRRDPDGGKRKIDQVDLAEVDFADITPQEKSLYLKRLAHLPEVERREVYKGYKGKGRYLPPEQLQKGIADEYEIDPKLNEGQTHQYHDVKRKRSERKQMHGGDCECCRGYYEAVGHLPRYNQAPKWNDAPDAAPGEGSSVADDTAGAVHHHQQLVSRHRETWQVGGTPPGYWSIGFPTSQDAMEQNRLAEQMTRDKEARIRRDAEMGNGKYRKKAGA